MIRGHRRYAQEVNFEWYDADDRTWHVSATVTPSQPGTRDDPPEGGEVEDLDFALEEKLAGGLFKKRPFTYEQFRALFGQEAIDSVEQKAYDTAASQADGPDPDDYDDDPVDREWKRDDW